MNFEVIFLLTGIVIGGVAGWLIAKLKNSSKQHDDNDLKIQLKLEVAKSDKLNEELQTLNNQLVRERKEVIHLNNQNATSKADYRNLKERLEEQKGELDQLQQKFTLEFKNLANDIFEEKSKKFTEQNRSNLFDLLNPLKDKIEKFEQKVERNNKNSLEWNTELRTELHHLKNLNQQMTKEAESLTKALKGDSKTQGNWGEVQVEMILQKVGLEKDVHYQKEQNFKTQEGTNQRLDYIIKLPDEKYLILDSKVSLTAYANYFDSTNEQDKATFLKQHLASIHDHIKRLGSKNYQNLDVIRQPDFILMFVANEPALVIALKEDLQLFEKALDKNIVLVSSSTLLATLRTVSYIWKQDRQNKNALEIARQAGSLYDKFTGFTEDMLKVGNNLNQTKDNYDAAMKKLTEGRGNLVGSTEKLRKLGAKSSKQIDSRLVGRASEG
ncbi:MAG: DNA recombination protein RmuC [Ekhidna sp.]|nr:DNA recombination protein RmuC [Ekhidna sp.]